MTGPLSGLRVFDLTRILAGPTCTQILGDLGAEIIKIERPGSGDDTRKFGPPFLKDDAGRETSESGYFLGVNRNKRSLTLDLTQGEGQDLARRLIAKCDILVENFKVGGLAKYGLSYDQLRSANPGLLYCSITGFGQSGPYAERPGYDVLIQGMGGFMSITGEPDGEPQKGGVPISDLMAGMYAAVGICAALRHRESTGEGQHIDIGMLDTTVATLSMQGLNYLTSGVAPPRYGNAHPNIVPYQVFATADGHIILAIANDGQFDRFCQYTDAAELCRDERFSTNAERVRNRETLIPRLAEIIAARPSRHWLDGLEACNVSCGPINTIDQVFNDPHVRARGMEIAMAHPLSEKPVRLIGSPLKMSATPPSYDHPPPLLGQHTDVLLDELLGIGGDDIAGLRGRGVI